MFHVKDNKQGYIFDPFEYLGPKRLSELTKIHGPKFFAVRYSIPQDCWFLVGFAEPTQYLNAHHFQ